MCKNKKEIEGVKNRYKTNVIQQNIRPLSPFNSSHLVFTLLFNNLQLRKQMYAEASKR